MPEDKSGADFGRTSPIKDYIKKNKFLSVSICILLVLIIVLVIVYTSLGQKEEPVSAEATGQGIDVSDAKDIEVLPQIKREDGESADKDYSNGDPFAGPMFLKGTIIGNNGNNQAVIDAGGIAYIVKTNDKIGSVWTVKRIDRKEVLLSSGAKELTLKLSEREVPATGTQTKSN